MGNEKQEREAGKLARVNEDHVVANADLSPDFPVSTMSKFNVSYEQVMSIVGAKIDDIKRNNVVYDCIVSIQRGGEFISEMMKLVNVSRKYDRIWMTKYDEHGRIVQDKPRLYGGGDIRVKEMKNVLVVDDILDTGETMAKVIKIMELEHVDLYVPFARERWRGVDAFKGCHLDVGEYIGDGWLVFPWERGRV